MSKFSPLGSCQRQSFKGVASLAPALIPRGFLNQPRIRHVDADHSGAARLRPQVRRVVSTAQANARDYGQSRERSVRSSEDLSDLSRR